MAVSRIDFEERVKIKHKGSIELGHRYNGTRENADFVCKVCNHEWYVNAYSVGSRNGCPKCKASKARSRHVFSYEQVKSEIEELGYELISTEYKKTGDKLKLVCPDGHYLEMSHNNLKSGHRCAECVKQERIETLNSQKLERIQSLADEKDYDILNFDDLEDSEITNSTIVEFKCSAGHTNKQKYNYFRQVSCCPECNAIANYHKISGKNANNWRGGVSHLISYCRQSIKQWKKDSMKSSGYKCIITGKRFDVVHHVHGFNLILREALDNLSLDLKTKISDYSEKELEDLRNEVIRIHYQYPLGVCLSKDMHIEFHKRYGSGFNTEIQIKEFIDSFKQ